MTPTFTAYNRFGKPVRAFYSIEKANEYVAAMAALGSVFTIREVWLEARAA